MKITITRDEIKAMVAYKYQLNNDDFTLHISEPRKRKRNLVEGVKEKLKQHKMSVFDLANALDNHSVFTDGFRNKFLPEKKITAIKRLREYYADNGIPIELFAAKAIVEEWDAFCKYCQRNSFVMNPNELPWRNPS